MAEKITTSQIEDIIKEKLKSSGLTDESVIKDSIAKIKDKILDEYKNRDNKESNIDKNEPVKEKEEDINFEIPAVENEIEAGDEPNPELIEKNVEQDFKEKELEEKEKELTVKEFELEKKEEDLKYKPQIPEPLKTLGKEEFFIFDENEISLGAESLSNFNFYMKNNTEMKCSMHSIWINNAMTKADLFKVKFEKIGELDFDPYEGTTKLIQFKSPENVNEEMPGFEKITTVETNTEQKNGEEDFLDLIIKEKINKILNNIKNEQ